MGPSTRGEPFRSIFGPFIHSSCPLFNTGVVGRSGQGRAGLRLKKDKEKEENIALPVQNHLGREIIFLRGGGTVDPGSSDLDLQHYSSCTDKSD